MFDLKYTNVIKMLSHKNAMRKSKKEINKLINNSNKICQLL